MKGTLKKLSIAVVAVVIVAFSGFLVFTPFAIVEAYSWLSYPTVFETPKSGVGERKGVEWSDDCYAVECIDAKTFAIGEPRYCQGNYSYLILGERRAILFDSGPGVRDIKPVVEELTDLPVTVVASHLHYDHLGNMDRFDRAAMLDAPELREQVDEDGVFEFGRYEHLGFVDGIEPPIMHVTDWWGPGEGIDLGGRTVRVLSTPGHTPYDMMLYDEEGGHYSRET